MFKKHQGKRSTNIVFVIFRLALSFFMLAVLLGGTYSAYKHFSGFDPLKLDPQTVLSEILAGKVPQSFLTVLSANKITGGVSDRISQKVLGEQRSKEITSENPVELPPASNLVFRFLLFADSHNDNINLSKAITQAKQSYPDLKFIIGLGDYTEVGTIQELKNVKKELDLSSLRYFLLPGDHDLWDCRNRELSPIACFNQVFGPTYQSFTFENFHFILLNNSDNYIGFDAAQSKWIADELEKFKTPPFIVSEVISITDDNKAIVRLPNQSNFLVDISSNCPKDYFGLEV